VRAPCVTVELSSAACDSDSMARCDAAQYTLHRTAYRCPAAHHVTPLRNTRCTAAPHHVAPCCPRCTKRCTAAQHVAPLCITRCNRACVRFELATGWATWQRGACCAAVEVWLERGCHVEVWLQRDYHVEVWLQRGCHGTCFCAVLLIWWWHCELECRTASSFERTCAHRRSSSACTACARVGVHGRVRARACLLGSGSRLGLVVPHGRV
jgi:hypothetical protein